MCVFTHTPPTRQSPSSVWSPNLPRTLDSTSRRLAVLLLVVCCFAPTDRAPPPAPTQNKGTINEPSNTIESKSLPHTPFRNYLVRHMKHTYIRQLYAVLIPRTGAAVPDRQLCPKHTRTHPVRKIHNSTNVQSYRQIFPPPPLPGTAPPHPLVFVSKSRPITASHANQVCRTLETPSRISTATQWPLWRWNSAW